MTSLFLSLPHVGIQTLTPYQPGKSIESTAREYHLKNIIKLASNENPLGCSPNVLLALEQLSPMQLATYPSAAHHKLPEQLSRKHGLKPEQILLSNGTDALFSLIMTTFALHTGRTMLTHEYAFSAYTIQAQTLGVPFKTAPINQDWTLNVDALLESIEPNTGILFLANPNNPTGILTPSADIKKILAALPETTLFVLDEAYIDYCDEYENTVTWLSAYPNLILLRTFSKIYGLAGLRLGYAMGQADIISLLAKAQLPFTINQLALQAGSVALEDQAFIQKTLQVNKTGMEKMLVGLQALSLKPVISKGNFITVDCLQAAHWIYEALLQQGIIVRPLAAYGLPNHLRITIGTPTQIERVLKALSIILNKEPL